ncbi:hypothetical protein GobsT_06180 [Gemmata obscuriglobus]|uniref:Uncharacterized protein n=1 Tax=Gemmata obscuriglobus TaxID=114 RepID=A0A2Z3H7L9_9BACT|nr:hypothetical protein [Gemmata obscuriglobus]AWM40831.1 hypothetical protein C1280_30140 [Gemmata obscuriglobus]QEG25883.1 hypothetical protein GobsT_06180 [Gemmata obscuriglobus]VTR99927.1 unnamed protein product [Gemmata obscuriglobus UQM 2246]
MSIRLAVALGGLVAGFALAQAQEPKGGAKAANVVPSTFRAQLVVDNRFSLKTKHRLDTGDGWPECAALALGEKAKDEDKVNDSDRDPRDRTGKMHDLVSEYGLAPVVAIFVRADAPRLTADAGLGKLLRGLDRENDDPKVRDVRPRDGLMTTYQADKLAAFVMFLWLEGGTKAVTVKGEDGSEQKVAVDLEFPHDEKRADKVKLVQEYACKVRANKVPFGLAADKSAAVTAFKIEETAPVTIVIYNRLRIVQRWSLKTDELTDEKVAEILAAIKKMVDEKKP